MPFLDLHAAVAEVRDELDAAWHRVMDRGWFIAGDELAAFEAEFAAYTGARASIIVWSKRYAELHSRALDQVIQHAITPPLIDRVPPR